jgi:hypothetical protein
MKLCRIHDVLKLCACYEHAGGCHWGYMWSLPTSGWDLDLWQTTWPSSRPRSAMELTSWQRSGPALAHVHMWFDKAPDMRATSGNCALPASVYACMPCMAAWMQMPHIIQTASRHTEACCPAHAATRRALRFETNVKSLSLVLSLSPGSRRMCMQGTVGAGLPVLSTLHSLRCTGDRLSRVEGVLSGTLSYIFNSFGPGRPFSEVVGQAKAAGYTEPDPREDLSGASFPWRLSSGAPEEGLFEHPLSLIRACCFRTGSGFCISDYHAIASHSRCGASPAGSPTSATL